MSIQIPGPFFNWVVFLFFLLLICKSYLHVLDTRLLSDTCFASNFFHSFLMVYFEAQKILVLVKSFYFLLLLFVFFDVISKKVFPNLVINIYSYVFFLEFHSFSSYT